MSRDERTSVGGAVARRALNRWARRLIVREWRQQVLIFVLVAVAVGGVVVGSGVSANSPAPVAEFVGTASAYASFAGTPAQLAADVARVRSLDSRVDVIENAPAQVPGSTTTFSIRAQDPHGPFGGPMLSLVSGHYPTGAHEVAVTSDLASELGLSVGRPWSYGGYSWTVTGIVVNPTSLLDEFALVAPGELRRPASATVLLDPNREVIKTMGANITEASRLANANPINPGTITLALAVVGMLLIALVAVAGFTAIAQRRIRAMGMLGAIGATPAQVARVVRANGLVVGVGGSLVGAALGLGAWAAYRPSLELSVHHDFALTSLPWWVVGASIVLAVLATSLAASYPARALARQSIVRALAGRPAEPRGVHRSAVPGAILVLAGLAALVYAGEQENPLALLVGIAGLVVGMMLLAPLALPLLTRATRRAPVAVRLATRDLARYRARSGSALAAMSLGIFIVVLVTVQVAARYGNTMDWVGPNVASDQVIVYTPASGRPTPASGRPTTAPGNGAPPTSPSNAQVHDALTRIQRALGATTTVGLYSSGTTIFRAAPGRTYSGPTYVATPQLLRAFGVAASSIRPTTDIITMRPRFAGLSDMRLYRESYFGPNGPGRNYNPGRPTRVPCPVESCVAAPPIQQVAGLPSGTSAPNTDITEAAVRRLHLRPVLVGWLLVSAHDPSASQVVAARSDAAAASLSIETRNSLPTSAEVGGWATAIGALLALGILAMTIGLIRSETADELRVLEATGASTYERRTIAATTGAGLAGLAGLVGTLAAYLGSAAFLLRGKFDSVGELWNVPLLDLVLIVVGLPVLAYLGVWFLTGNRAPRRLRAAIE